MDFIFMLTRDDRTVGDCLHILDLIAGLGIRHIGFKDIGVDLTTLEILAGRLRDMGAVTYLEVVSTTPEDARRSIAVAQGMGIDRVCGGQETGYALDLFGADGPDYFPFVGRPTGHPTRLGGTPAVIAGDCRAANAAGCGGVDLLAYRATESDPLALVRAAREALDGGYLMVAGGIDSPARIRAVAEAGADGFTIGSAVFNGSFSASKGSLVSQLRDIQQACAELVPA